jgi:hypothetical protein
LYIYRGIQLHEYRGKWFKYLSTEWKVTDSRSLRLDTSHRDIVIQVGHLKDGHEVGTGRKAKTR